MLPQNNPGKKFIIRATKEMVQASSVEIHTSRQCISNKSMNPINNRRKQNNRKIIIFTFEFNSVGHDSIDDDAAGFRGGELGYRYCENTILEPGSDPFAVNVPRKSDGA